jgi:uncharacterized glyoxalase superfamily protein PhnB
MSTQTIFPAVRYRDADAALTWLNQAFGAEPIDVHRDTQDRIAHAELRLSGNLVMLGTSAESGSVGGGRAGPQVGTVGLYIAIADPDAAYPRAIQAGAEVVRELSDTGYGSRGFSVRDLEGNPWSFGTYNPYDH